MIRTVNGEAVKNLSDRLADSGFTVVDQGLRLTWAPDEDGKQLCRRYGAEFAEQVR